MPRDLEEVADSGKSEEEAATTIQAVYRGYKARRRFHEVSGRASKVSLSIRYIGVGLAQLSGWDSGTTNQIFRVVSLVNADARSVLCSYWVDFKLLFAKKADNTFLILNL